MIREPYARFIPWLIEQEHITPVWVTHSVESIGSVETEFLLVGLMYECMGLHNRKALLRVSLKRATEEDLTRPAVRLWLDSYQILFPEFTNFVRVRAAIMAGYL